jgi:hypothetical protein
MFQKTKYYPVNVDERKIVDTPFNREKDLFDEVRGTGYIGIKGDRLNTYGCYKTFSVLRKEGKEDMEGANCPGM